jgi:hypothetical protein
MVVAASDKTISCSDGMVIFVFYSDNDDNKTDSVAQSPEYFKLPLATGITQSKQHGVNVR